MYPQVFGKYVLERELARGGMARVVLATLRGAGGFEKKLVVKQIRDELASDDDFIRRFVLEAKTTVKLAHPNIVPVYELGVELGTYFLAMELVEGASLAELLRAVPRTEDRGSPGTAGGASSPSPSGLSPDEGAYVGVEVCRALDYAHRRMNVVHRDVTPRNVMVDEEGQVKVIDFGIAAPATTATTARSGHGVFGSPGHMPPEQMEARELTPAADVFAVAVLLMELWSGKAPFRRHTRDEVEAAMRSPHPKPSDADPRLLPLDEVIASAMALDPMRRPQHAEDLGRALRRFLAGVDLGDLARHLGDRVRDLRVRPAPPATERRPFLQRPPSRPTATQMSTKTFAARDEVAVRPAASNVDGLVDVSTRRLESRPPDGLHARSEPLPPIPSPPSAATRDVETAAMPPLEATPRRDVATPRKGVAAIGALAAGALAVTAFFLGRAATVAGVARVAPAASHVFPRAPSEPVAAPSTAASWPLPASSPSAPTSPTASSVTATTATAATAERAQLLLLGDGAYVSLDGVQRGPCPVRIAVDAGNHAVLFSFPPTGETKGESLTLRAGERTALHADFTAAAPVIRRQSVGQDR